MRRFTITIETDDPDATDLVRIATEKIACEVAWNGDNTASIEATETFSDGPPEYLAGYELEPA